MLKLGANVKTSDGSTLVDNAKSAFAEWNGVMEDVQFSSRVDPATTGAAQNGQNEVFFANNVYGESFGENVASVTVNWVQGTTRVESDIILNKAFKWDAYRGLTQFDSSKHPILDFRRALLEGLAFSLGLAEDNYSITNPNLVFNGGLETLTDDDLVGIANLYGFGPNNRVPFPVIYGTTSGIIDVFVGDTFSSSASILSPFPVSCRWERDGIAVEGLNSTAFTRVAELADAGIWRLHAWVTRAPSGPQAYSQEFKVRVTMPARPSIQFTTIMDQTEWSLTQDLTLEARVYSDSKNYSLQWYKDGVAIPGATSNTVPLVNLGYSDAGAYKLVAINAGGTTESTTFNLTVLEPRMPKISNLRSQYSGQYTLLYSNWNLKADIGGSKPAKLRWYRDGVHIAGYDDQADIWVPNPEPGRSVRYQLIVGNFVGSTDAEIVVQGRFPEYPHQVPSLVTNIVYVGEQTAIEDYPSESLGAYQWFRKGVPVESKYSTYLPLICTTPEDDGLIYRECYNDGLLRIDYLHMVTAHIRMRGMFNELLPTSWSHVLRLPGKIAFAMREPSRLDIYDLATRTWTSTEVDVTSREFQAYEGRFRYLTAAGLESIDASGGDHRLDSAVFNGYNTLLAIW